MTSPRAAAAGSRPTLSVAASFLVLLLAVSAAASTLQERLESRIAALPDLEGAQIAVLEQEGQVLLQGRVRVLEQSLRAEQTVWKTPGVIDVDNELRVVSRGAGGDAALLRTIRTLLKADGRFVDTSLEVDVTSGEVRLSGLFANPADVLTLKHLIAAVPGVLALEIEAQVVAFAADARAS